MTQTVQGVRSALLAACRTLYLDEEDSRGHKVTVSNGPPGTLSDYIVMVGKNTRQAISKPTMGSGRSRERDVQMTITVSTLVPGTEVSQQVAIDAHDHLIDLLETYLRTSPNETLGGACRESWVSEIDGPILDFEKNKQGTAISGRVAESVVTITAKVRY